MNFQTGLAVGDVGEVREVAALQKEALQVKIKLIVLIIIRTELSSLIQILS